MDLDCIYNISSFIEKNYNNPISIKDLERISFYSYRNIQRIFKYSCGETIGAYQKRLRVENAYKLILYTKKTLSDIALEVGFDNLASFSKAFKQSFGVSPKEARLNKKQLFAQNALIPTPSDVVHKHQIVHIPPLKIYYQSTKTAYINEEIETLWEKFLTHTFPEKGIEYYGVVADEPLITDKILCRYDACSSFQAQNKNLPSKTILGGRYARFLHEGSYSSIDDTYTYIYTRWILTTDLEFSPSPIIEHYIKHDSNTENEMDFLTAILIPIMR